MTELLIRHAGPLDEVAWTRLFTGYRDFYRLTPDEAVVKRVWSWILDRHHETHSIVAEINGMVIGIADYRTFTRPSTGTTGLWLDDLFTDREYRGRGVGRSLIEYLLDSARQLGCPIVRWITAEDNREARQLYDTLASRTNWVTYDASPATLKSAVTANISGRANRVAPDGATSAVTDRGLRWGNRGPLLNASDQPARHFQGRSWIICRLEFHQTVGRLSGPDSTRKQVTQIDGHVHRAIGDVCEHGLQARRLPCTSEITAMRIH